MALPTAGPVAATSAFCCCLPGAFGRVRPLTMLIVISASIFPNSRYADRSLNSTAPARSPSFILLRSRRNVPVDLGPMMRCVSVLRAANRSVVTSAVCRTSPPPPPASRRHLVLSGLWFHSHSWLRLVPLEFVRTCWQRHGLVRQNRHRVCLAPGPSLRRAAATRRWTRQAEQPRGCALPGTRP